MANTYTTVDELKKQLNIESTFTDDDQYLLELISVAEMAIDSYCNGGLNTGVTTITISGVTYAALPKTVKQATLLLAAHFYINRTPVAFAQGQEIPYTFAFLLQPYRNNSIA